jgi:rare lipoprotein A
MPMPVAPPVADDDPLMALVTASAAASAPVPAPAPAATGGWWLQLGAFRQRDGAASLHQRAAAVDAKAALAAEGNVWRVRVGPYPTRADALLAADRLRSALQLAPLLLDPR